MILKIFYHSRETTCIKDMTCNSKDSIDVKNTTRMMSYKILNLLVTAIIKVHQIIICCKKIALALERYYNY